MKKNYIWSVSTSLAIAVAIMSSCSTDDTSATSSSGSSASDRFGEQNITLMPTTTKATTNTLDLLQDDGNGIPIYAITADASTGFYIGNVTSTYDSSSGYWTLDNSVTTYTWPTSTDNYPMSFYSCYPASTTVWNVTQVDGDGSSTERSLSAVVTIGEASTQHDMLSAKSETSVKPVSGLLPISFNHVLSRVYLTLNASSGVNLYIKQLDLCGVIGSNTYDLMTQTWATLTASGNNNTSYNYIPFQDTEVTITTSSSGLDDSDIAVDNLMLIPQSIEPWEPSTTVENSRVELFYRTALSSNSEDQIGYARADSHPDYAAVALTTSTSASSPLYVKIALPVTAPQITTDMDENRWYDGYEYNYTMTLGGYNSNNGYLADANYYDEDGVRTDFEVLGSDVGDEVTPGDICFSVSVMNWNTAEDTELAEI